jgi:hypothetical protein
MTKCCSGWVTQAVFSFALSVSSVGAGRVNRKMEAGAVFVAMDQWSEKLVDHARRIAPGRTVVVVHVMEGAASSIFDPLHDQLDKLCCSLLLGLCF